MDLQNKNWHLLDIPEGTVGPYSIKHHYENSGLEEATANMRCALLGGQLPTNIIFDYSTRWHSLEGESGTWMTDRPCEQVQHDVAFESMDGTILIGGLGLGYAVSKLATMRGIRAILVVERSQEVIDLVWPHIEHHNIASVVCADLFDYLHDAAKKEDPPQFDWAFLDIWQSDGERTFFETVLPLRKLVADSGAFAYPDQTVCWNEDVMRGQLVFALQGMLARVRAGFELFDDTPISAAGFAAQIAALADEEASRPDLPYIPYIGWRVQFFEALRDGLWHPSRDADAVQCYTACWGLPGWQNTWETFLDSVAV